VKAKNLFIVFSSSQFALESGASPNRIAGTPSRRLAALLEAIM
jgi:hypothetical protein